MLRGLQVFSYLIACAAVITASPILAEDHTSPIRPAERAYKNIQALKGIPADELIPAMEFITASLGVDCGFCHVERHFDQDRLRKNLKEMPPEAAAYKRYLKKFDDQETEIERLQKLVKDLQEQEHARRKEYENFLANLTVE